MILLCILGTIVFQVHKHGPSIHMGRRTMELFGESFDYPVSQQKAIGEKSRILFDNVRGNVRITGGDAAEIHISGRKTIRAYNKVDADKANDQCPLEVITEGDRVIVRTNQEKVSEDRRVTNDLEVTVPRGVMIEGRGRLGRFRYLRCCGRRRDHKRQRRRAAEQDRRQCESGCRKERHRARGGRQRHGRDRRPRRGLGSRKHRRAR